jgi:hypothetical protein
MIPVSTQQLSPSRIKTYDVARYPHGQTQRCRQAHPHQASRHGSHHCRYACPVAAPLAFSVVAASTA